MPFDSHSSRPRRVALFSGNYNYVMDGPVRALNKLVAFLESQGIEVLVFAPTAKEAAFPHNGTLISVPSVALPGRSEYRIALGMPASVRRRLTAFRPDLIHVSAPDLLGHAALRWARRNFVPSVASFHTRFDTYPRYYHMGWAEKYITALMRRFYKSCEHVYVPSESMVEILKEQAMAKDLRIWSRGVEGGLFNKNQRDMDWRRSLGIQDDEKVITFVGRLVLEKGLGVFADTLDALKAKGVPFRALIVGEGPERERFEKRLPEAVFTGYLQGDALARAYASSDVFFNASITETFGNVTLEAMASGIPAVCADATGSRTLVDDNVSGFLVEPGNIEAFAEKLTALIEDEALYARMSDASLEGSAPYTWEAVLGALLDQYQEAVATYRLRNAGLQTPSEPEFAAAE
ncbi:glycosyltransferase family 4 protein [Kordiimonas marina]|uniref:glycosyltransferase family 4 protein n=1 Tax=Kordiimonas marina TaxID=2872312 RepID=UPI001FF5DF4E|nr:glycosyltransferase family 1 protein [Kordiimonas marina]MCJ9430578.1 glycosyltransferase family 1 protein [Kordiimonas marina]